MKTLVEVLLILLLISNSSIWCKNVLNVSKEKALIIAMIVRDDEPSLSSTLPIWLSITKYFVFIVDNSYKKSSLPSSYDIIQSFIKTNRNIHSTIELKPFTTYDKFREITLNISTTTYPQASHIWLTNSDWLPILSTININDLDNDLYDLYEFEKTNRYDNSTIELSWIVRNKLGLRMKYSFNEVIDPLSVQTNSAIMKKTLKWKVDELEKYYSWDVKLHPYDQRSGVSHLENIDILLSDLDKYGPDAHIHYYLGIEHYQYLMTRQQLYTEEISKIPDAVEVSQKLVEWEMHRNNWNITAYHFQQSTYYLQLRLNSLYPDNNSEEMNLQRGNVIGLLGYIHATFFNWDIAPSYYYFNLCLTQDPTSFFCIKSSMDASFAVGDYDAAYNNVKNYLKAVEPLSSSSSPLFSSIKSSNLLQATCMLPILFIKKMLMIYLENSSSQHESLYYLLVIGMVRYDDKLCPANAHINYVRDIVPQEVVVEMRRLLETAGLNADFEKSIKSMDLLSLCKDEAFVEYLNQNSIKFHPCGKKATLSDTCSHFVDEIAPPTEQQHLANYKEFLGALR